MTTLEGPTGTILGARVRLDDGTVGEVWAEAPPTTKARWPAARGYPYAASRPAAHVWVAVAGQAARHVAIADLRPADDQPTLFPEEPA